MTDIRALLAVIAVVGAFFYQAALLWAGLANQVNIADLQIPSWMSAITMGIIGFYFGSKGSNGDVLPNPFRRSKLTIEPSEYETTSTKVRDGDIDSTTD